MKFLHTDKAPAAVGPYSQGVHSCRAIYVSGQLPVKDSQMQTDFAKATTASLENILSIISAGGGSKENIVKCVIFLTDMDKFSQVNEAYAAFFGEHKPARSCVEVSRLPKDAVLEIEAIAMLE
jgi:2-iminobutanoate/2-iminopropanoate deaminase